MSSFENLEVWKRSKRLAVGLIGAMAGSRNWGLKDQMIRSSISIPSNIAEGAERKGRREFANFISYASGSCAELFTQVAIAAETGDIDQESAEAYSRECREIRRMLYALRQSLE